MIYRLMYGSRCSHPIGDKTDDEILKTAVKRNRKLGITGVLIRTDRNFIQVLEGAEPWVKSVYDSIRLDDRHRDVHLIAEWRGAARMFPNWSMDFCALDWAAAISLDEEDSDATAPTLLLLALQQMSHSRHSGRLN